MLDAARHAERLVAAEDNQHRKPALTRPLGVREAILERVLGGHEGHDALARDVVSEVGHEVTQIVFFVRANGAVGQEHERALTREALDRVIRVNPGVHAFASGEFGARRPQLSCEDGRSRAQGGE